MVIDPEVCYDLNGRISTHVNDKRMQKSKSAHQNHRRGIKTRKMTYDVIEGHWRWMTSVYLGKVTISLYQCKRWISLRDVHIHDDTTSYRCAYHQQKKNTKERQVRKFLALKRYERKFRWHDLESRSQVKQRSWQVQSWDFQGRCKFSKIRLHNILLRSAESSACYYRKTRGGVAWTPVPTCVPLKPMTHMYLNYGYTPSPEMVKLTKWLRQTSLSWWKRVIQK